MEYNVRDRKYTIAQIEKIIDNDEIRSIDWYTISVYQTLTETFIEKHKDNFVWYVISRFQILSETFIEKYKDKVDWSAISFKQKLSESFIEQYKDKLDFGDIVRRQMLSIEFLERHLYEYNLFMAHLDNGVNKEYIDNLVDRYSDKYYIDRLEYELQFT